MSAAFQPGDIVSVRSHSNVVDRDGEQFRALAVITSGPFTLNSGQGYSALGAGNGPTYPYDQTYHRTEDILPLGEDDGLTIYGDAERLTARYEAFRAWAYPNTAEAEAAMDAIGARWNAAATRTVNRNVAP